MRIKENVSYLVNKKMTNNTKTNENLKEITDHYQSNKYITNLEFNMLTSENFPARLKQTNLANKSDIDNFVKNICLFKMNLKNYRHLTQVFLLVKSF